MTELEASAPPRGASIVLELSRAEIENLVDVSHHYERVMGFPRHLVVLTAPARIRRKYRYIVYESSLLANLAEAWLAGEEGPHEKRSCRFELGEAVRFWGRILANLRTKRSRRPLSPEQVRVREGLDLRFGEVLADAWQRNRRMVLAAVETRPGREARWMLERLE